MRIDPKGKEYLVADGTTWVVDENVFGKINFKPDAVLRGSDYISDLSWIALALTWTDRQTNIKMDRWTQIVTPVGAKNLL